MDNVSRALMIAGGMLFTILIISLLIYAWTSFSEYQQNQYKITYVQELAEFNRQFTNYNRDDVQGYELISLVNKVIDYNQRHSSEFKESSVAGNRNQYSPITIEIKLDDNTSTYNNRDKFITDMTIPAVARSGHQTEQYDDIKNDYSKSYPIEKKYDSKSERLFKNNIYKQSNTDNEFASILNVIRGIENNFGGASNAQTLVKSRGAIFESKVFSYNGQPSDSDYRGSWNQQSYIISRYKTITGKTEMSIDNIRNDTKIRNVLKYYEYMEFKKAEFECTSISYDDITGRVIEINFEIN